MIDWKQRALELAEVIDLHRKDRMHTNMKLGWALAKGMLELAKREKKARQKFHEYWHCPDKKEAKRLYAEYLELMKDDND